MAAPTTIFSRQVLLPDFTVVPAKIVVEGSLIKSVEVIAFAADEPKEGQADGCVHLGDRLVTPAFVNAHTHLSMASLRGAEGTAKAMGADVVKDFYFTIESKLEAADVRAFSRMGCYESLLSGVGLVWDHYYFGRAVAEALEETGLAGVVAPTLQDITGPGVALLEESFSDTATIATSDVLRHRGIFAALGPHATDTVSDNLWRRIVDVAKNLGGLPIHSHVAQSIQEFESVHTRSNGRSPLGLLDSLGVLRSGLPMMLVHGQYASAADIDLIDRKLHVLGMCPRSHMVFCFPTPAPLWHKANVPIALATDAACSNDDMNVQNELRILSGMASFETTSSSEFETLWKCSGGRSEGSPKSPTGDEVLQSAQAVHAKRQAVRNTEAATSLRDPAVLLRTVFANPGCLHPSFRAGVIEPGALANIVIWDVDHPNLWPASDILHSLVMCDTAAAIDGMMVAGRWIGRSPQSNVIDGSWHGSVLRSTAFVAARKEATKRLDELLHRAGLRRGTKRPFAE
eukprot:TRINITY_DN31026_c0_g1_i1.p1 TRINITY_DN31026_c0_g1~~TRINITY_DN31026_c0_g1_i1.p1  ORF type:complete len:514 (+),score=93.96 TRINITY_DN31026_c0_g1_i1:162-1703(+)